MERLELYEEDTPYFAALGRFISAYALAEAAAMMLTRSLSGLEDERSRIAFGGMRLSDISERLRKFAELEELPDEKIDCIEDCLQQLSQIGKQRDKLVHRRVSYEEGHIHVSNSFTSKSLLSFEEDKFSIYDLKRMQSDCETIYIRLHTIEYPNLLGNAKWGDIRILHSAWKYTPPSPKRDNHMAHIRKRRKSSPRRPPASRE